MYSFLTVVGLFCCLAANAQFLKYSNEFLNIGAGARGMAMGGAQVASVTDGTAGYWNPAALVNVKDNPQLNLMHAEYYAGIGKYDFANLVLPLKDNKRTLGLTLLRFAVDDIPNTVFLVQPDGSVNYNNVTSFSSADYAFIISLAQQVDLKGGTRMNVGVNTKIIRRVAGSFASAWGFGFDGGAQFVGKRWKLGIVAKDVTTTFNAWSFNLDEEMKQIFTLTGNEIPVKSTELTAPQLILGGSYNFRITKKISLLAEADLDVTFDGKRNTVISSNPVSVDPKLGLELAFKDVFFVRAGVNNFQQALDDKDTTNQKKLWVYQPSLGAGFKVGDVQIDYAFTNLANQSAPLYTHVFSLRIDLKRKEKSAKR
ncbi:MAG: PorV/PorQ family protein [Bacteroidota bacterium]|nr:PorV/PorQ family protein [Bacteroidota bacterium]MDP4245444.1 PorV/PorQ family protein [Bacteroidota bacterium]MDP4254619.1 PorV/PorQ family protein [Bacteroidota bacterium]MDP4258548.1 PorV/PorQ family protein [Bacteroidota bacterium]